MVRELTVYHYYVSQSLEAFATVEYHWCLWDAAESKLDCFQALEKFGGMEYRHSTLRRRLLFNHSKRSSRLWPLSVLRHYSG